MSLLNKPGSSTEIKTNTGPDNEELRLRHPIETLKQWMQENLSLREPLAFILATVDSAGQPFTRTLLAKEITQDGLIFYTNSNSMKGQQIQGNAKVAALFFWDSKMKQVTLRGSVKVIPKNETLAYWKTRPRESQINQYISQQSSVIESRAFLVDRVESIRKEYEGKEIPCPDSWNGYALKASEMEIWVGREFRLHDRFLFKKHEENWKAVRLSP